MSKKYLQLIKNNLPLLFVPFITTTSLVLVTSCRSENSNTKPQGENNQDIKPDENSGKPENDPNLLNKPLVELIDIVYGEVEIVPTELASSFPALEKNWPLSNIIKNYFLGLPEDKAGIKVEVSKILRYSPERGEITIAIKYTKDQEAIEKNYLIRGFKKIRIIFDDVVDKLYADVQISLTPSGREMVASQDIWTPSMIQDKYFQGLPTDKEGIKVVASGVIAHEWDRMIEISFKFTRDDEMTYKTFTVEGFKQSRPLLELVREFYPNIEITPKDEAKKLTATKQNWPLSKINPSYFNGLPEPKNGISLKVVDVICEPSDGVIYIQYEYSKGSQTLRQTYIVEGFKKI